MDKEKLSFIVMLLLLTVVLIGAIQNVIFTGNSAATKIFEHICHTYKCHCIR